MKRSMSVLSALPLVVLLAACHTYVPAGALVPAQGTPIRVHLVRPASFELGAVTAHNIGLLDGEMVRRDRGDLVLSARWLEAVTGQGFPGQMWTLTVDDVNVGDLQVKRFSKLRTAALFVGGLAATYLGFEALGGSGSGSGQPGGGGEAR